VAGLMDLMTLVGLYRRWPATRDVRRYLQMHKAFTRHVDRALDFLDAADSIGLTEAKKAIRSLRRELAWNVDVAEFSVQVDWWTAGDDVLRLPWLSLGPLVEKIGRRVARLPLAAPARELYALLLAELLPIYFLKAANLSAMLAHIDAHLPDLVIRACGAGLDMPAAKRPPTAWDFRYDACRGFVPYEVGGVHVLALIYNPEADAVGLAEQTAQRRELDRLGERARQRRVDESTAPDLQRLVGSFCGWSGGAQPARYAGFLVGFHRALAPALDYLSRLSEGERAAARRILFRLRRELAWNAWIDDFSLAVDWSYAGTDARLLVWPTLRALVAEVATRVKRLPITAPARELYALLLAQLLPIYFLKAANISPMVELLERELPDLVLRACAPPRDQQPRKAPPSSWDVRYDACRGFDVRGEDDVQVLALLYNPEADAVPSDALEAQRVVLSRITGEVRWRARWRPVVHFIWYGHGAPNRGNTGFANAIVDNAPHVAVRFWCLADLRGQFRAALSSQVTVSTIEELLTGVQGRWGLPFRQQVDRILSFYLANRGNAPAKDMLTYLVLALHGGYFFDANCEVLDWSTFGRAVCGRPHPTFLNMGTDLYYNPGDPAQMDWEHIMGFADGNAPFPQTDMWGMYAPPDCDALATIAAHYVARAVAYGFDGVIKPKLGGEFVHQLKNGDSDARRTVAGSLGIHSIFAGMHRHGGQHGWDPTVGFATRNTGKESYIVPELSLTKSHGHSW
jgi:hypothetical protein